MKKILSILLALVMCLSVLPMAVSAEDTLKNVVLPKPAAPNYFVVNQDFAGQGFDMITVFSLFDDSLVQLYTEYDVDSEAFFEKYGVVHEGYGLFLKLQYDVNVDGKGWQYIPAWDEVDGYTGSYAEGYDYNAVDTDKVDEHTLADLYWEEARTLYKDVIYSAEQDSATVYHFDLENHSIQIRCRYQMQYTHNYETVIKNGEWSDIAVVGKGSTQIVPVQPTSYEAPVISNMKIVPPVMDGEQAHVYFELDTPDSVWDADMYYQMNGESTLGELQAEISINGGDWIEVYVGNSHWPLSEGDRQTSTTEAITQESNIKLRVRYGGPLGYSAWSNVLEVNSRKWVTSPWAEGEVQKAYEFGLIPDCLLDADLTADITRAEFAAVAVKVYEALSDETATLIANNPFTDCNDVEVLKAYNIGAVNGTSATTYDPDALLNREQAATMLTRVYKKIALPGWTLATDSQFTLAYEKPAAFADDAQISSWAKDSVYFMAANKLINGVGDNLFAPKNTTPAEEALGYANATREQALIIAARMVENLGK